ncbi:S41 family peptidase [Algisphaera agarilytica]|uniref:Carboxyl-terminal processing protease n=1 Tax=Algisphaera agarilytica TaxID=1385975 RepID=A0A7X0LM78_9BACT|nr:S41 family peptidase [Algisphaera agarilytica]MBB6431684.1 carboxyl-terminal processing protease [Algisphaera agarilytica]
MNNRLIGNLALASAMAVLLAFFVTYRGAWARSTSTLEHIDLLVDLRYELANEYVDEPDQQELIEGAIDGMIESLDDPYTQYFPQEEFEAFNESVRAEFTGIGAEVTIENNRLHIVTPLEDSPAWKSGVMAGDTVMAIEGEDTLNMPINEAISKLKGPAGTDVSITVRHASGEEVDITITRAKIEVQTVRGFKRNADHSYNYFLDPENKVGFIRLTQFSERTTPEVLEALQELKGQGIRALVIDMRYNPGGLLNAAVDISDMFLEEGQTIVSVRGRKVPEQVYKSTSDTLLPEIPVVVLANSFSASASEIVAGALADNGRALFVGERTFGKGSVQQVKRLLGNNAGALKITNAYYYLPSGRNIHRRNKAEDEAWGVDPSENAYVPMTPDQRRERLEARQAQDIINANNGQEHSETVTPEWINETLKDPQLAAALTAILGKLDSGEWPVVGKSNADELVRLAEREQLTKQRELLEETLAEVNEKLAKLDDGQPIEDESVDAEAEAEAEETAADAVIEEAVESAEEPEPALAP